MIGCLFFEKYNTIYLFLPENNTNATMSATAIHDFSLHTTDFSSLDNLPDLAFVNEHFGMILNVGSARNDFIKANQPYRFLEGRILWVTDGWADIELTLEEYHIKKGDIVLLAPESIIELKSNSPDYNMIGIIYNVDIPVNESLIIHAGETEMQETLRMANILWDTARHTPFRLKTVTHLLSAIITNIQYINRTEQESTLHQKKTSGTAVQQVQETCQRALLPPQDHTVLRRATGTYSTLPFQPDSKSKRPERDVLDQPRHSGSSQSIAEKQRHADI